MEGIIAALPTPFDQDMIPQNDMMLEHANWALENGCDGLNLLGSSGEAPSIDLTTRKTIASTMAREIPVDKIMVATGVSSIEDTGVLTNHADALGFPVALVMPPSFYNSPTDQGLIDWYTRLAKILEGRAIKVYFYNYPQMMGYELPVNVMNQLVENFPGRFCGIKDSSGQADYLMDLEANLKGCKIFPSSEITLTQKDDKGVYAGCISGTVNISAPLCARFWQNRNASDLETITAMKEVRDALSGNSLIANIKYLLAHRYENVDWEHLLPPHCMLSDQAKETLGPMVEKYGRRNIMSAPKKAQPTELDDD